MDLVSCPWWYGLYNIKIHKSLLKTTVKLHVGLCFVAVFNGLAVKLCVKGKVKQGSLYELDLI